MCSMIKSIIVDDEYNAIKNLKWEIDQFCKDVQVIEAFTNPVEAISAINYLKPDCVFLDIEMPEMDGFEMLASLHYRDFDLIITSAYDNYAIKAFRQHAMDYLLKPIDSDDLKEVLDRIRSNKKHNILGAELKNMLDDWNPKKMTKVALPLLGKTLFVFKGNILYCKSDGSYCEVVFNDGKKEVMSKKLKEMEELLGKGFFRLHNSYLIRLDAVKEYVNHQGYYVVLEDGSTIPVSRSKKQQLLQLLNG
ncbi:LytTR family two component transcriptional regulator [Maribacter polysiphoniae]|uniref:LytTR family two component transcriptional regulator n=2 Tax=Maribacter polysiphoniae TaxID=429344 RepID=A0A316DUR1_9FLAO|nr:LytTR family two component transcriptional regulator [Maribacter polysiphoniae]